MKLSSHISFTKDSLEKEIELCHPKLPNILEFLATELYKEGFDTQVTSIIRKLGQLLKESGVHSTGRAIDCIPVPKSKMALQDFTKKYSLFEEIAQRVNKQFPRQDKYKTCLWHSAGYGWHFHIQVPADSSYSLAKQEA